MKPDGAMLPRASTFVPIRGYISDRKRRMKTKIGITPTLLLAAAALLSAQSAHASTYAYRLASVGVRSPDVAPTLGSFSVATLPPGSAAFLLTPPSSTNSQGKFSYVSSNLAVATVSGSTVTIVGVGTTTITASQAPTPGYLAASVTATFSVSVPAGYLASGGLLWLIPTATQQYWSNAKTYCTTGAFAGWRLPTSVEAKAMALDIGATRLTSQGWNQSFTWTGTQVSSDSYGVFLNTGGVGAMQGSTNQAYVTCVR